MIWTIINEGARYLKAELFGGGTKVRLQQNLECSALFGANSQILQARKSSAGRSFTQTTGE
jgi:hypothetical protein